MKPTALASSVKDGGGGLSVTYRQKGQPMYSEAYLKKRALNAKRTREFIAQFPDGATAKDFKAAGVPLLGIDRLMKHKVIEAIYVAERERGPRCFHWKWKILHHTITNEESAVT